MAGQETRRPAFRINKNLGRLAADNKDILHSYHIEAWVEFCIPFLAVKRMISSAWDILRVKRSSLAASNFEKLIFMRGNVELMGSKRRRRTRRIIYK